MKKQTANKRADGTFAPGNRIGNRFQKGETGNPTGRPRATLLSEALRAQLAETLPAANEYTVAEAVARSLIREALKGDVSAAREIADRTEGRAKQSVDLDMSINDWRTLAQNYGVTEQDVIEQAKLLIAESIDDSSGE